MMRAQVRNNLAALAHWINPFLIHFHLNSEHTHKVMETETQKMRTQRERTQTPEKRITDARLKRYELKADLRQPKREYKAPFPSAKICIYSEIRKYFSEKQRKQAKNNAFLYVSIRNNAKRAVFRTSEGLFSQRR